jgi:protein-disulfide isomerase
MAPLPRHVSALALWATAGVVAVGATPGASPAQGPEAQARASAAVDPRVARADEARIAGRPDAKLWVLMVSDFQCPYCKQWHDEVGKAFNREFVSTGKVRLAYVHFPLRVHANAQPAAEASMCAGAQGKFWEYHDRLFATVARWGTKETPSPEFLAIAKGLGLDSTQFTACLSERLMQPMVAADQQRGRNLNVRSTPTFFVGNTMIEGAASLQALRSAVNQALPK